LFHAEFVILNKNKHLKVIDAYQLLIQDLNTYYGKQEAAAVFKLILEDFGLPRDEVIIHPERTLRYDQERRFFEIITELTREKPIQYVLGYAWFFDMKFYVNEDVLIPRQETEILVDIILRQSHEHAPRILDIGTGSGCIAISLKKKLENALVFANDFSEKALQTARKNAEANEVDIQFFCDDILKPDESRYPQKFNLIVSNPPYVRESEKAYMKSNVTRFEPPSALYVSDADPLIFYRKIATFCEKYLLEKGMLFLEINENLGEETAALFRNENFSKLEILKDLSSKDRFLKIIK